MSAVRGGAVALAVVMSIGAAVHSLPADAGSTSVRIAGGLLSIPVISIREAKFKSVIQQQFDYSCGSAALATLLSFHYDRPTTEAQTFEKMFEVGDQDAIRRSGFSLLDMKNYLDTLDMRADGFRISLDEQPRVYQDLTCSFRGGTFFPVHGRSALLSCTPLGDVSHPRRQQPGCQHGSRIRKDRIRQKE